ncbi:hypothetical protein AB0D98_27890 [Streptomyces sp. NPDC047987]|uniref:Scr1 family TA system antitoxin-like transcriptional regulator n=1 Tax=unclassified Streptomyces TaxID=2593676 RepID=UPI00342813E1
MTAWAHPVIRAIGAYLRDARERRYILPAEPAELLATNEETVLAMEAGHHPITVDDLDILCCLYLCTMDAGALKRLARAAESSQGSVADDVTGHHRRLAGCARQAVKVRWLSTGLVPAPVQTDAYAQAVSTPSWALPGAPLDLRSEPQILLDERVLYPKSIRSDVMAKQLQWLLQGDCTVRVMPGRIKARSDRMVVMTLPAGFVLAQPSSRSVLYRACEQPPASVAALWDQTTPHCSRYLLQRAVEWHLARAAACTV